MASTSPFQVEAASLARSFQWNHVGLRQLLRDPSGPVYRDLARRAVRIEAAAKVNASHSPPSIPGEGPAVQTGRLRGSITFRLGSDTIGPYADVGSNVAYAAYVELGTQFMEERPFLRPALHAGRF